MLTFEGRHFKKTIVMMGMRWYLANSLSCRNIEEFMVERGVDVDQYDGESPK